MGVMMLSKSNKFILIVMVLIITACSSIKMLTPADIYSSEFLKRIDGIQNIYKDGDKATALRKLRAMDDAVISSAEQAKKYNLIGIIYFSGQDFDMAIENFETSRSMSRIDISLTSQVHLNLASSYYKKEMYEKSYEYLKQVEVSVFSSNDKRKFYRLQYVLAQHQNLNKEIVEAAIHLMVNLKSFSDIADSPYKEVLIESFRTLSPSVRVYLLEDFDAQKNLTVAYLAKEEAMHRYYLGDRNGSEDVVDWLKNKYPNDPDVLEFIGDFNFRIENYSKIDIGAIGVVLPLSGSKSKFGQKALTGIDSALNLETNKVLAAKIYTRDSNDSPFVAKKMINDLIQKHHVSIIIGGLFSSTAAEEYLEAKKYGVLFISLSPVHLEKEKKNHLLIEVPGSIESQMATLLDPGFLDKFGKRVAVIYPRSEGGEAYVNELWRKSQTGAIDIVSIHSYEKKLKDYREPVSKILGLKFKRERTEELKIWKEIHSLSKKRSSIRRIQTLKPVVDFDWVFAPSFPKEALQIVPAFSYYDAKRLKFIGGPSWMARTLVREQRNLGRLYFVGDDPKDFDKTFATGFKARYSRSPRLIETLAFEAMNTSLKIIDGTKFEKREELERRLINMNEIDGITGKWSLKEGIWLKQMDFLRISRGSIKKFDYTSLPSKSTREVEVEKTETN